jgi:hypothetical protein
MRAISMMFLRDYVILCFHFWLFENKNRNRHTKAQSRTQFHLAHCVLQNQREAESRRVTVIPTIQFFKTENDHDNFLQYLPSKIEIPWHYSGLIGVHVEKIKEALCAISSGNEQHIGESLTNSKPSCFV